MTPFEETVNHLLKKLSSATGVTFENKQLAIDVISESIEKIEKSKSDYFLYDFRVAKLGAEGTDCFFYAEFHTLKEKGLVSKSEWVYHSKRFGNVEDCTRAMESFVSIYKDEE